MTLMQRAIALIYPDQCAFCTATVDMQGGLCAECWRDTRFVAGHICDLCAAPLPGASDGVTDLCDECLALPRPWVKGRAALYYEGVGRKLALALKYGDRTDLAAPAAGWIARAAGEMLSPGMRLVPVPAHWRRLIARRYNPAVELARALGRETSLEVWHDALVRHRATPTQEGLGVEARFANVAGAISANPKRFRDLGGQRLCLIDDTMTSGATLAAATEAALDAGVRDVSVLVLARAVKAP